MKVSSSLLMIILLAVAQYIPANANDRSPDSTTHACNQIYATYIVSENTKTIPARNKYMNIPGAEGQFRNPDRACVVVRFSATISVSEGSGFSLRALLNRKPIAVPEDVGYFFTSVGTYSINHTFVLPDLSVGKKKLAIQANVSKQGSHNFPIYVHDAVTVIEYGSATGR